MLRAHERLETEVRLLSLRRGMRGERMQGLIRSQFLVLSVLLFDSFDLNLLSLLLYLHVSLYALWAKLIDLFEDMFFIEVPIFYSSDLLAIIRASE
jgi:hypothetical protein